MSLNFTREILEMAKVFLAGLSSQDLPAPSSPGSRGQGSQCGSSFSESALELGLHVKGVVKGEGPDDRCCQGPDRQAKGGARVEEKIQTRAGRSI